MTPAARIQAAIECLDDIFAGTPAEKSLTNWARRSRYAGSKDRAAVRDHVFQSLRCLRSHAALGGSKTGRGLLVGALREDGIDPAGVFTGEGHAPSPLSDAERAASQSFDTTAEEYDIPEWLWPLFQRSLGQGALDAAGALRSRAPVFLRVNLNKTTVPEAIARLSGEEVLAEAHGAATSALRVTQGARRIKNTQSYLQGFVELQDAASQAVVDALPLQDDMRVLDYCAGGGGKALAMAARARLALFAHDIDPRRMKDLPQRAERAGVRVTTLTTEDLTNVAPFDLVLCDAPCSGSGSWRRDPEGKWRLSQDRLEELVALQASILDEAAGLVSAQGRLAFATCSMLDVENGMQAEQFLNRNPEWQQLSEVFWQVQNGTDGFYVAVFQRRK
ncbi:RsmB/NOP family class I SAM-dependent RNA methyltransferase [Phaeobacter sp. B1627]|uniref:RsmB/NOP family class I SAM-dependent RNA methyltransferase n=1 Tax=Phaeobacter sp. B1627 TaxID=2583809 RepID=UPI00111A5200|nr:RsmB/NOP family class I SAM-dependent RNA methyltransferase [Phaeobacter sp. B1627]TNJ40644.1 RsmB/NOP family class I SAM-dependent RNA methyltransferase [Phaeobacter sp. B1627]